MKHEKTFAAIAKLSEVEAELHRLKNALEMANRALEAKDEPVGWFGYSPAHDAWFHTNEGEDDSIPLYRRPQPTAWVGLTDEEIQKTILGLTITRTGHLQGTASTSDFARAIEAKLKEKNT